MADTQEKLPLEPIAFGPFKLIPGQRLLEKDGLPVALGSRSFDILLALAERPQEVVPKQELLERAWPRIHVEETSLRVHISALRKALGDGQPGHRYITNVAGHGYRFTVPASENEDSAVARRSQATLPSARLPPRKTLIARDDAIEEIEEQLIAKRFVSVVGTGGVGKTAVTLSVAHSLAERFDGNVYLVDLGTVNDPAAVASAVALAVGVSNLSGDPASVLLSALRQKRALILFDGFEHLIETAAPLAEAIFRESPSIHILATGREALRCEGEQVYRLQPLGCPPDDPSLTAVEILKYPATRLFVDRLNARGSSANLNEADVVSAGTICRQLDGIALAIELAAGHVHSYGIQGIESLLGTQLALALSGNRTARPRQQTLSATIDWSYRLLSEYDQSILRRLGVFAGEFSFQAAQAVACQPTGSRKDSLTDVVDSLVSKSILAVSTHGTEVRYRLLDTTRAYLRALLTELSEADDVARRHATYFLQCLETRKAALSSPTDIGTEFQDVPNVIAALAWAFSPTGDRELSIGLAANASSLFLELSLLKESRTWAERGIAAIGTEVGDKGPEAELWANLSVSRMLLEGDSEAIRSDLRTALALSEKLNDVHIKLRVLSGAWLFFVRIGNYRRALAQADSIQLIANSSASPEASSLASAMLGTTYHLSGDQANAQTHCERSLALSTLKQDLLFRRYGYNSRMAGFGALSRVLWLRGFPDKAVAIARETLELGETLDHPVSYCLSLTYSSQIFFLIKDLVTADGIVDALRSYSQRHCLTPFINIALGLEGKLLLSHGDLGGGVELLRRCLTKLEKGRGQSCALQIFATDLAEGLSAMGAHDEAITTIETSISHDQQNGGSWYSPEMLRVHGIVLGAKPDVDYSAATDVLLRSIGLSRQHSSVAWELRAATSLVRMQQKVGRICGTQKLQAIYSRFTEGHGTPDLEMARELLTDRLLESLI